MDIDFILGVFGASAIFSSIISLPATYGALVRQDVNADWKKLPLILRSFYDVDLNKDRDERGWLSKHPEMISLGILVVLSGFFLFRTLIALPEVNEQTGELQINTNAFNGFVPVVAPIFWWAVFTFGTEWWLKRKWLPKHVIRDEAEQ